MFKKGEVNKSLCYKKKPCSAAGKVFTEKETQKGGMEEKRDSHTTIVQQIGSVQWTCVLCLGRQ